MNTLHPLTSSNPPLSLPDALATLDAQGYATRLDAHAWWRPHSADGVAFTLSVENEVIIGFLTLMNDEMAQLSGRSPQDVAREVDRIIAERSAETVDHVHILCAIGSPPTSAPPPLSYIFYARNTGDCNVQIR